MFILAQLCAILALTFGLSLSSSAIVVSPTEEQMQQAIAKGKAAAQSKIPPTQLYWRFGSTENLQPHGIVMTKLGGIAVLSAHFSFRSVTPSEEEIRRIIEDGFLQVSVTIFGLTPSFAVDSYVLLKQGERLIKPEKVRSDAHAHRSAVWPNDPPFKAKVVASFPYGSFDPLLPTTVSVFPGEGGEIDFKLDFSTIQ